MGIKEHAHADAALFSTLLSFLTYGVKWLFGLNFPEFVFVLPTFLAVFMVFYLMLYIVFFVALETDPVRYVISATNKGCDKMLFISSDSTDIGSTGENRQ